MTDSGNGQHIRTRFTVASRTLIVDLRKPHRILSSAVRGGGIVQSRYIVNHQVPANPREGHTLHRSRHQQWSNPAKWLGQVAKNLGIPDKGFVGLMTAVSLNKLVRVRAGCGGIWVESFVTVGITNAVRAGERPRDTHRAHGVRGTINIILVTNARLSHAALVGAIQVAVESKTAALFDRHIPSWTGRSGATGTGTDSIVLASAPKPGPYLRYSGTHTAFGALIGRVVYRAVTTGLSRCRGKSRTIKI